MTYEYPHPDLPPLYQSSLEHAQAEAALDTLARYDALDLAPILGLTTDDDGEVAA